MSIYDVPVFDVEVFRGSTFYLELAFKLRNEDGDEVGPYDLTGLSLEFAMRDVLGTDKTWSTDDEVDDEGSYVSIVDPPTDGRVNINVSSTTLESVRKAAGDYSLKRVYGPNHSEMMMIGTVVVNPISMGGEI